MFKRALVAMAALAVLTLGVGPARGSTAEVDMLDAHTSPIPDVPQGMGTDFGYPIAQTFTALHTGPVSRIRLDAFGYDYLPVPTLTVDLVDMAGGTTPGNAPVLATATVAGNVPSTTPSWLEVSFTNHPMIQAGHIYAIRLTVGPDAAAGCCWAFQETLTPSSYTDGTLWWSSAGSWSMNDTKYIDVGFEVYVADQTPPSVVCDGNPVFVLGSAGVVTATVTDTESGPVSQSVSAAADTSKAGPASVALTGVDAAGNQTTVACPYSVAYGFTGFSSPVANNGVVNVAQAGRTVPLKWRLVDASGQPVNDLASAAVTVADLDCGTSSTTDLIEEYAPGGSGLRNLGDGYYSLNWQTPSTYAGSCKTLRLDLGEGSVHTALFQFKN
jgi:hypothetical protein